jgi:hypothetical protein
MESTYNINSNEIINFYFLQDVRKRIDDINKESEKFPLLRERLDNPYNLFENLKRYIPKITQKEIQYKYILWKTKIYQNIKYKNKNYVAIETQKEDYINIDRLVDYFNELPRMKARRRDKCYSPLEAWDKKETILESWLQNKSHENVSILDMREQIWKMGFECNAFKATLAISIYKMFQVKRILDFSAGWGDRLLASIAYGAERYLGYDPNPELQNGYQEMISMFTNHSNNNSKYEVKMEAFETANMEETETFDLIFTSPPYYDFETYIPGDKEAAKTQSIVKYPRFHTWMVEFLFKSILKCWNKLIIGGNMVIHLSDVYKTNYVEAMIIFILGWCEGSRFDGSIASIGDCGKPRPLWVFHKLDTINIFHDQILKTRERMKIHYSDLYIMLQNL